MLKAKVYNYQKLELLDTSSLRALYKEVKLINNSFRPAKEEQTPLLKDFVSTYDDFHDVAAQLSSVMVDIELEILRRFHSDRI